MLPVIGAIEQGGVNFATRHRHRDFVRHIGGLNNFGNVGGHSGGVQAMGFNVAILSNGREGGREEFSFINSGSCHLVCLY